MSVVNAIKIGNPIHCWFCQKELSRRLLEASKDKPNFEFAAMPCKNHSVTVTFCFRRATSAHKQATAYTDNWYFSSAHIQNDKITIVSTDDFICNVIIGEPLHLDINIFEHQPEYTLKRIQKLLPFI